MTTIHWQWSKLGQLSPDQLYEILRLRQAVFAVEQNCVYQDTDGKDQFSWHLAGWSDSADSPALLTYLRVVFPGEKYAEPSIGRVVTAPSARGAGLGRELMRRAITLTEGEFPGVAIRISAQEHLQAFYQEFGFVRVSAPYDEDGISHIEMLRACE